MSVRRSGAGPREHRRFARRYRPRAGLCHPMPPTSGPMLARGWRRRKGETAGFASRALATAAARRAPGSRNRPRPQMFFQDPPPHARTFSCEGTGRPGIPSGQVLFGHKEQKTVTEQKEKERRRHDQRNGKERTGSPGEAVDHRAKPSIFPEREPGAPRGRCDDHGRRGHGGLAGLRRQPDGRGGVEGRLEGEDREPNVFRRRISSRSSARSSRSSGACSATRPTSWPTSGSHPTRCELR